MSEERIEIMKTKIDFNEIKKDQETKNMFYNIHSAIRQKLVEIHALLQLDSIITVRAENEKKVTDFFDKIQEIIRCL